MFLLSSDLSVGGLSAQFCSAMTANPFRFALAYGSSSLEYTETILFRLTQANLFSFLRLVGTSSPASILAIDEYKDLSLQFPPPPPTHTHFPHRDLKSGLHTDDRWA